MFNKVANKSASAIQTLLENSAVPVWVNVVLFVIPLNVAASVWVNVVLLVIPLNVEAPVWVNVELLIIYFEVI